MENFHDQQNSREIYPENLRCGGTCNPIGVDISTTNFYKYGGHVCSSGEDDLGKLFASSVIHKEKPLSPIVGDLITMPVKKIGLGLLNTVISATQKYLSFHQSSAELIQYVRGEDHSPMPIVY